mgnify:CR=1 FL=1
MLNDYPWLQPVWDNLKVGLETDRIPGALLLQSEQGLGIEKLIEFFSQALLCQNYASEACGFCHSCQLNQSHNHPDLHPRQQVAAPKRPSLDPPTGVVGLCH